MPARVARALDENQGQDHDRRGDRDAQVSPRVALRVGEPAGRVKAGEPRCALWAWTPAARAQARSAGGARRSGRRAVGAVLLDDADVEDGVALERHVTAVADDPPHDLRGQLPRDPHAGRGSAGVMAAANEPYRLPGHRHGEASVISAVHEVPIGTKWAKLEPGLTD